MFDTMKNINLRKRVNQFNDKKITSIKIYSILLDKILQLMIEMEKNVRYCLRIFQKENILH